MNAISQFYRKYDFPYHWIAGWRIVVKYCSVFWGTSRAKLKLFVTGCEYGRGLKVRGRFMLYTVRKRSLRIGDNVMIVSSHSGNLVGLTNPTIFVCNGSGCIEIGDSTGISSAVISSCSRICIGRNVKIGGNVRIFDHDFHALDYRIRRSSKDKTHVGTVPVRVGDDVFIGTNAMILKGVSIGDRSIIGAGSVVTRDVPSDEIWAGNPARRIREMQCVPQTEEPRKSGTP